MLYKLLKCSSPGNVSTTLKLIPLLLAHVLASSIDLPIKAIVVSTLTGKTAIDVSSLRPNSIIVATVTDEKVARSLALKWGVYPKIVPMGKDTDDIVNEGVKAARELMNLRYGDLVAVIGGFPKDCHTNFLKIHEV